MNDFELEILLLGVEADTWVGDAYLVAVPRTRSPAEAARLVRTTLAGLAAAGMIVVSCQDPETFEVLRLLDVADLSDDSLVSGMTEDGCFASFEATEAGDAAFRAQRGWTG